MSFFSSGFHFFIIMVRPFYFVYFTLNSITKGSLQELNCYSGDQLTVITGVIYFYLWYLKGLINGLRELISHKTVIMNMSIPKLSFFTTSFNISLGIFVTPKHRSCKIFSDFPRVSKNKNFFKIKNL